MAQAEPVAAQRILLLTLLLVDSLDNETSASAPNQFGALAPTRCELAAQQRSRSSRRANWRRRGRRRGHFAPLMPSTASTCPDGVVGRHTVRPSYLIHRQSGRRVADATLTSEPLTRSPLLSGAWITHDRLQTARESDRGLGRLWAEAPRTAAPQRLARQPYHHPRHRAVRACDPRRGGRGGHRRKRARWARWRTLLTPSPATSSRPAGSRA